MTQNDTQPNPTQKDESIRTMLTTNVEQNPSEVFPFSIEYFTEAKDATNPGKNEDLWGINDTTIVLSDGATDKGGKMNLEGLTGGQIASQIVVTSCLESNSHGEQLVEEANAALAEFYKWHQVDIRDPLNKVAASLLCIRLVGENLVITRVNNSGFRLNGNKTYIRETICDGLHARARADYIRTIGNDIKGARDYILPLLQNQLQMYQNNPNHSLGYGVIDGTQTPTKFIDVDVLPLSEIETLEIFTDGYSELPTGTAIEDWEAAFNEVQRRDPNRCLDFPATKTSDDRTILILRRKN